MTRQSIGQRLRRACRLTVPAWQQKNTIHDDLLGIKRYVPQKKKKKKHSMPLLLTS